MLTPISTGHAAGKQTVNDITRASRRTFFLLRVVAFGNVNFVMCQYVVQLAREVLANSTCLSWPCIITAPGDGSFPSGSLLPDRNHRQPNDDFSRLQSQQLTFVLRQRIDECYLSLSLVIRIRAVIFISLCHTFFMPTWCCGYKLASLS